MRPVRTAARALLGAVFVFSGARALANPEPLVPKAKRVTDRVGPLLEKADPRLPSDPRTLVRINGAAQVTSGLLLASGRLARPAAAVLAGSLVPTTVAAHAFWAMDDPAERQQHQIQFLKNLGLLGGLLLAAADTQGRPSLRWQAGHLAGHTRRSMRRALRTAQREARIAKRAAATARRLPG
jgi:putative oxidoreductase